MDSKSSLLKGVTDYFTEKINTFGAEPKGVDWNSTEAQHLRFKQITSILTKETQFSILDYGCGYGELYPYLKVENFNFNYLGYDICEPMIVKAKSYERPNAHFTSNKSDLKKCDYVVSSGIFNIKIGNEATWRDYVISVLSEFHQLSNHGFSFNMLTSYSDKERKTEKCYYADPCFFFDYCKKNFSKTVALLHDYKLYDFTILVRKDVF